MPGIITSRTRALYQRPPQGPYCLNWGSPQARGLAAWWPLGEPHSRSYTDYARGRVLTQNGTMTVNTGPDGGFAASNTGSTSNWLSVATAIITADPCTLACWFNPANLTANSNLIIVGNATGNDGDYHALTFDGANAYAQGDNRVIADASNASTPVASTTSVSAAGEWHHACAVFASTSSRSAYLDGGGKATNTAARATNAWSKVDIGAYRVGSSTFSPLNGRIAHACLWDRALSDAEVRALYDPATRWDLYYPLGRKTYSFATAAGGGGGTLPTGGLLLMGCGR